MALRNDFNNNNFNNMVSESYISLEEVESLIKNLLGSNSSISLIDQFKLCIAEQIDAKSQSEQYSLNINLLVDAIAKDNLETLQILKTKFINSKKGYIKRTFNITNLTPIEKAYLHLLECLIFLGGCKNIIEELKEELSKHELEISNLTKTQNGLCEFANDIQTILDNQQNKLIEATAKDFKRIIEAQLIAIETLKNDYTNLISSKIADKRIAVFNSLKKEIDDFIDSQGILENQLKQKIDNFLNQKIKIEEDINSVISKSALLSKKQLISLNDAIKNYSKELDNLTEEIKTTIDKDEKQKQLINNRIESANSINDILENSPRFKIPTAEIRTDELIETNKIVANNALLNKVSSEIAGHKSIIDAVATITKQIQNLEESSNSKLREISDEFSVIEINNNINTNQDTFNKFINESQDKINKIKNDLSKLNNLSSNNVTFAQIKLNSESLRQRSNEKIKQNTVEVVSNNIDLVNYRELRTQVITNTSNYDANTDARYTNYNTINKNHIEEKIDALNKELDILRSEKLKSFQAQSFNNTNNIIQFIESNINVANPEPLTIPKNFHTRYAENEDTLNLKIANVTESNRLLRQKADSLENKITILKTLYPKINLDDEKDDRQLDDREHRADYNKLLNLLIENNELVILNFDDETSESLDSKLLNIQKRNLNLDIVNVGYDNLHKDLENIHNARVEQDRIIIISIQEKLGAIAAYTYSINAVSKEIDRLHINDNINPFYITLLKDFSSLSNLNTLKTGTNDLNANTTRLALMDIDTHLGIKEDGLRNLTLSLECLKDIIKMIELLNITAQTIDKYMELKSRFLKSDDLIKDHQALKKCLSEITNTLDQVKTLTELKSKLNVLSIVQNGFAKLVSDLDDNTKNASIETSVDSKNALETSDNLNTNKIENNNINNNNNNNTHETEIKIILTDNSASRIISEYSDDKIINATQQLEQQTNQDHKNDVQIQNVIVIPQITTYKNLTPTFELLAVIQDLFHQQRQLRNEILSKKSNQETADSLDRNVKDIQYIINNINNNEIKEFFSIIQEYNKLIFDCTELKKSNQDFQNNLKLLSQCNNTLLNFLNTLDTKEDVGAYLRAYYYTFVLQDANGNLLLTEDQLKITDRVFNAYKGRLDLLNNSMSITFGFKDYINKHFSVTQNVDRNLNHPNINQLIDSFNNEQTKISNLKFKEKVAWLITKSSSLLKQAKAINSVYPKKSIPIIAVDSALNEAHILNKQVSTSELSTLEHLFEPQALNIKNIKKLINDKQYRYALEQIKQSILNPELKFNLHFGFGAKITGRTTKVSHGAADVFNIINDFLMTKQDDIITREEYAELKKAIQKKILHKTNSTNSFFGARDITTANLYQNILDYLKKPSESIEQELQVNMAAPKKR